MVKKIFSFVRLVVVPLYLIIVTFSLQAMDPNAGKRLIRKQISKQVVATGKTVEGGVVRSEARRVPKTSGTKITNLVRKHIEELKDQASILTQAEDHVEGMIRKLSVIHDDAEQLNQRMHAALRDVEKQADMQDQDCGGPSQSIEKLYRQEVYYLDDSYSIVAKSHDDQPGSVGPVITVIKNLVDDTLSVFVGHAIENNDLRVEELKKIIEEFHAQLF